MSNKSDNKWPRWVNTVLVMVIGYAMATVTLKAIAALSPANVTSRPATTAPVTAPSRPITDKRTLGREIADLHIFGDASKPKTVENKPKPIAPVNNTRLNLKLAGVFAYQPQERAMAIISADNKPEDAYRVGDKILGNVTLKSVHADHVIISNNGKDERVPLPENVTPIASRRPVQQRAANANAGQAGQADAGPVELPQTPGALRDTLAKNPSLLGRVVAAEPYQENGQLRGYRIIPKQNPEILEAQGIIAGDIITRVNNIELNSQKQGIRALRNAVKAQNLEVSILRDGVEIPVSISLAE